MSQDAARQCLEDLDVPRARELWKHVFPHLPQMTDQEVVVMLHMARTEASSVRFRYRAYSHAWLMDRALPSQLPDRLKPRAERIYPVIALGVGISCSSAAIELKPLVAAVRYSMEDAVMEAFHDGKLADAAFVKDRMKEARSYTMKKLIGARQ